LRLGIDKIPKIDMVGIKRGICHNKFTNYIFSCVLFFVFDMSFTIRKPQEITASYEIAGKQLTFKTGILAPSCDGAVRVKLGQTEVLVTTVMKKEPNPDKDFLPLTIDFRDSNHAVGKIGGGPYRRREGRPTEMMTLYSRIVDRTLRPMFPKGMVNDIVISITPLSFDREDDLAILGII